jgi:hypothetical protein
MSASDEAIYNARDLIIETLAFANAVPATVTVGSKFSLAVRQKDAVVTVSAKKITGENNAKTNATENVTSTNLDEVTIDAEGLYALTVSAAGYAPWTTTVYVEAASTT